jgi:hypothetical protein
MRLARGLIALTIVLATTLFNIAYGAEISSASIQVKVGEKFPLTIRFNEDPEGCRFALDPLDEGLVKLVGQDAPQELKRGSSCWMTWIFEGLAKGETAITAKVMRGTTDEPLGVYKVTVRILDSLDPYRNCVDNFDKYFPTERERCIRELETLRIEDVEKNYLLGMLYSLQGFHAMMASAREKKAKPRAEDVAKEPGIREYFEKAEQNYDTVEKVKPGYKFIYCKYAELYRISFNEDGLRKITNRVGGKMGNETIVQCKKLIEDIAEGFAK